MYASDCEIGKRFKNINDGRVLKVIVYDGDYGDERLFECEEYGDLWSYVDERMYVEIL